MKVYIDVEATEAGEIIALGAVSSNGKEFYELVQPIFSKLTPMIHKLTGITDAELERAARLDSVLIHFYNWLYEQSRAIFQWKFYSYGNADIGFFKKSIKNCRNDIAYLLGCQIIATLQDSSLDVKKFFKQQAKLQHVYNYIQNQNGKQKHNALEDANMLYKVVDYMEHNEPMEYSPFHHSSTAQPQMPKGIYIVQNLDCTIAHEADDMDGIIAWLLRQKQFTNIPEDQKPKPIRLANKIAEAAKKGVPYNDFYWIKSGGSQ